MHINEKNGPFDIVELVTSWSYQNIIRMKSILITFALLFTGVLSAQQMELDGKVYGSITSVMYKEAKLSNEVSPQIFHELTLAYDGYRIFFAKNSHFIQCMQDYGNAVGWELTLEEERNLRNYIKRNGGRMPKYKPVPVREEPILPTIEEAMPVDTSKGADSALEESSTVTLEIHDDTMNRVDTLSFNQMDDSHSTSNEELTERNLVVLKPTSEAVPLNRSEVRVTPPMKFEGGRLTMMGQRLTVREAKLIARSNDSESLKQFRKASRLRSWNWLWGYYSVASLSLGVNDGDFGFMGFGVGMGALVGYREDRRIKAIEKGVYEYNKTLPGAD